MKNSTYSVEPTDAFSTRLKTARETLGVSPKEAAKHLFLSEKIITLLEQNEPNNEIPPTFLRGYLRAYAKFLQIPAEELNLALAGIHVEPSELQPIVKKPLPLVTSGHYHMQLFTYVIIFTLAGLFGGWWYSHSKTAGAMIAENKQELATPHVPTEQTIIKNTAPVPAVNTLAPGTQGPIVAAAANPPVVAVPLTPNIVIASAQNNAAHRANNEEENDDAATHNDD